MEGRTAVVRRMQVVAKIEDAKWRACHAVELATDACCEVEYDDALAMGVKAASDYETWNLVLSALDAGQSVHRITVA